MQESTPLLQRPEARPRASLVLATLFGLAALVALTMLVSVLHPALRAAILDEQDDAFDAAVTAADNPPLRSTADLTHLHAMLPERIRNLMDASVDPCTDFHTYACANWEKDHSLIPADSTGETFAFSGDRELTMDRLKQMMQIPDEDGNLPPPPPPLPSSAPVPQKVMDYYQSCDDVDEVERVNVSSVRSWLDEVEQGAGDARGVARLLAKMHMAGMGALFSWLVLPDHDTPTRMQLYLQVGGLGLPAAKFYLAVPQGEPNPKKDGYLQMIREMVEQAGVNDDPVESAHDTWVVEAELAAGEKAKDKNGHIPIMQKYDRDTLHIEYPHFDWTSYFAEWDAMDIGQSGSDQIVLTQTAWMSVMDNVLAKYSPRVIQRYLRSKILINLSPLMPIRFLHIMLRFEGVMSGRNALFPRWKKCIYATKTGLPFMISQSYIANWIAEPTQRVATAMMEDIRLAFERELQLSMWMSNETRDAAVDKLKRMDTEVAYPMDWSEYLETDVEISPNTYLQNYVNSQIDRNRKSFDALRHPTRRSHWRHMPIVTNAYYSSGTNTAFLPVGMLQDPFYNLSLPAAYNFGSVGSIMGHELTHGFDNTGHRFDGLGKRRTWWDKITLDDYLSRANCFQTLYDGYQIDGVHVNGHLTLGEDIADVGGVKTAYNAFLLAAELYSPRPPSQSDRQLFWLAYASTRCGVERKKNQLMSMQTSAHPPRQFRLIGPVSQLREFSQDFQCPLGSPMNPISKCELW